MKKRVQLQEPSERKAAPMSVVEIENEREVTALNALLGNVDDGGDITWPGAFAKTLQENWGRVRVLWQHDSWEPPIGTPVWAKEIEANELPPEVRMRFPDAVGGLLSKVLYLDTPRGNEVLTGIKAEAIKENSFGYDPVKFDFDEIDGRRIRNLRELKLWDIGPVNWGMNAGALTVGFKARGFDLPLGETGQEWNSEECLERVRAWASKDGGMDWERYGRAFAMVNEANAERAEGYKLLVGDIVEEELMASPLGVMAAGMELMMPGDWDEGELAEAKEYLGEYYRKMGVVAPWDGSAVWDLVTAALTVGDMGELKAVVNEVRCGGVLTGANVKSFQGAADVLAALVEAASEPTGEGEPDAGAITHEGASLGMLRQRLELLGLEIGY